MKTLIHTLIPILTLIFLISSVTAQQASPSPIKNIKYIDEVVSNVESLKISKMQNIAADYNIKDSNVYSNNKFLTYDVSFKETNANIKARFNSDGEILNSIEIYTNMRLPLSLAKKVITENKNWAIVNNTQIINYDHKNGSRNEYLITLKKGSESKQLKFAFDNNNLKSYIALTD